MGTRKGPASGRGFNRIKELKLAKKPGNHSLQEEGTSRDRMKKETRRTFLDMVTVARQIS